MRNLRLCNKHKLADRWESTIYIVQKRAGDLLVYTVSPEGQDGPIHTLHHDLLLSCGFLSEADEEIERPNPACRPTTRQTPTQPDVQPLLSEDDNNPSFYPMKVSEIEGRLSEGSNMPTVQRKTAVGCEDPTRVEYLPVYLGNPMEPEVEHQTLPVDLPDISGGRQP